MRRLVFARCLSALRYLLPSWPLVNQLTDGWVDLGLALQNVRAFARSEITQTELRQVEQLIRDVDHIVQRT
jgi:hypothetical protein